MEATKWLLVFTIIVLYCYRSVNTATMQGVKDIHDKVLEGYNKNILPITNQSAEFEVRAGILLLALSDLDETEERLTTVMHLELFWTDESITWGGFESGVQVYRITLDASSVWKPHIAVTNAHATSKLKDNDDWDLVEYYYSGDAHWTTRRTFQTTCEIDTTYYPFDVQRCSVEIFIYGYYGKIKFRPMYFERIHLMSYKPQGTWNITDFYLSNQNGPNVTVTYHLERNPRYMVINFLVPLLVLALLNPIVLLLPAGSGERIGYSITIMLALSVYMTLLGEYLPKNSDPIPIMTYTIMMLYILSAASLVFLFLSARIYNTPKSKPVPEVLKTFVVIVRKVFCEDCHCRRKGYMAEEDEDENIGCIEGAIDRENKHYQSQKKEEVRNGIAYVQRSVTCKSNISWHSVSKAMDVIFMVSIYIVKILFVLIILRMLSQREELKRVVSKEDM